MRSKSPLPRKRPAACAVVPMVTRPAPPTLTRRAGACDAP